MIRRTPIKRGKSPRQKRPKPRPGRLQGEDLEALRLACYERDNGLCVVCGKPVSLQLPQTNPDSFHMAHKRGKRMWGDHIDQVQTECGSCHREYHNFGPTRTKPVPPKV